MVSCDLRGGVASNGFDVSHGGPPHVQRAWDADSMGMATSDRNTYVQHC